MATIKQKLADFGERFNEICDILSEHGRRLQVTHRKGGFALCMEDGQTIIEQLTESDLKGVLSALWLMAGETEKGRSIASFFILKDYHDFHLA